MLDYLAVDKVTSLDSLHGACICFRGDDPDGDDTVGSEPVDCNQRMDVSRLRRGLRKGLAFRVVSC